MWTYNYTDELYHYGTKGMKWGVRRYQNKDGSLTKAGKKRYSYTNYSSEAKGMSDQELRTKIERMRLEKRYMDLSKNHRVKSNKFLDTVNRASSAGSNVGKIKNDTDKLKNKNNKTQNNVDQMTKGLDLVSKSAKLTGKVIDVAEDTRVVKTSKPKLEKMSDQELRDVVNRMDMEQQYASLRGESISRGKINAMKVLEIAGDVLAVGASAAALAVSIKGLRK